MNTDNTTEQQILAELFAERQNLTARHDSHSTDGLFADGERLLNLYAKLLEKRLIDRHDDIGQQLRETIRAIYACLAQRIQAVTLVELTARVERV